MPVEETSSAVWIEIGVLGDHRGPRGDEMLSDVIANDAEIHARPRDGFESIVVGAHPENTLPLEVHHGFAGAREP